MIDRLPLRRLLLVFVCALPRARLALSSQRLPGNSRVPKTQGKHKGLVWGPEYGGVKHCHIPSRGYSRPDDGNSSNGSLVPMLLHVFVRDNVAADAETAVRPTGNPGTLSCLDENAGLSSADRSHDKW
jgi:hypothetical protein